jgi:hypothetical protein
MPVYRLCILGLGGQPPIDRALQCAEDASAKVEVRRMAEGRDAELWKAGHLIVRFSRADSDLRPRRRARR